MRNPKSPKTLSLFSGLRPLGFSSSVRVSPKFAPEPQSFRAGQGVGLKNSACLLNSFEEMGWFSPISRVDQKSSEATLPLLGLGRGLSSPPPSQCGWPGNLANESLSAAFVDFNEKTDFTGHFSVFLEQLQVSEPF